MIINSTRRAIKSALNQFINEYKADRLLTIKSKFNKLCPIDIKTCQDYFFTSEKGIYKISDGFIYKIADIPSYGIAFNEKVLYLSVSCHDRSLVVKGDVSALFNNNTSFNFKQIYRIDCRSTNERIHGICLGDKYLWIANTGRNTLLKIDTEDPEQIDEIPLFYDKFNKPILYDQNHINSVVQYGDFVLFAAYRAGNNSMLGFIHENTVTGYSFHNTGVHDIAFSMNKILFCNTFGDNTDSSGGYLMINNQEYDWEFFNKPPGYIVRGIAGNMDEIVIGHSHKGKRSQRFNGNGSLLIGRNGRIQSVNNVESSQIYQIISHSGDSITPIPKKLSYEHLSAQFNKIFGKPVYQAELQTMASNIECTH